MRGKASKFAIANAANFLRVNIEIGLILVFVFIRINFELFLPLPLHLHLHLHLPLRLVCPKNIQYSSIAKSIRQDKCCITRCVLGQRSYIVDRIVIETTATAVRVEYSTISAEKCDEVVVRITEAIGRECQSM